MAITTGYFNSVNGDRTYNAETMSNYYVGILTRGVLANYNGGFVVKVVAGTMNIQIQTGRAYFSDGKWVESDAIETRTIETSDLTLPRVDRVVLHRDISDGVRTTTLIVKKGTPASIPTAPECVKDDYVEELSLATIWVGAKATFILQSEIADTRPDSNVCGFVTGVVDQLDLTDAYLQYQAGYEELIEENQQEFDDWFDSIKDTIASSTLIRSYESTYTTTQDNETVIPIGITEYNQNIDILQVYINGMKLIPTQDFTVNSNTQITLTQALCNHTPVNFTIYKSIDGSDAETVVSQVYALQEATADSGWNNLALGSGVTQYDATNYPVRCRKIGKQVYIEGLITNAITLDVTIATIPSGFRPAKNQIVTVPVSKQTTGKTANLIFYTTGEIKITAVNSSETLTTSDYISLKTNYLLD